MTIYSDKAAQNAIEARARDGVTPDMIVAAMSKMVCSELPWEARRQNIIDVYQAMRKVAPDAFTSPKDGQALGLAIEALNVVLENVEASCSTYRERIETIGKVAANALAAIKLEKGE